MSKLSKKKAAIKAELILHNWVEDRWGHLKKTIEGTLYRIKFQRISIRKELKSSSRWIKVNTGYISKVNILNADTGSIDFVK